MKRLIKKILRETMDLLIETMIPTNNTNQHENNESNFITIAQDDKTKDFLLLAVELHKENDAFIYSYFFQVVSENGDLKTNRLYTRNETNQYLPQEIKKTIIPLVKQITIALVNRIKPKTIKRTAMEYLNEKGMVRYNEISNLLQSELGYKLIKQGKDEQGKESWLFMRNGVETNLNEDTIEEHYNFNSSDLGKSLSNANVLFAETLKKNWPEHRRLDEENKKLREGK